MNHRIKSYIKENWAFVLMNVFLTYYAINESILRIGNEDFKIFYDASVAFANKKDIYNVMFDIGNGGKNLFLYPPFFVMVMSCFSAFFSYPVLLPLWLLFNLVLINRVFIIILKYIHPTSKQVFIFLLFLMSLRFILHNFDLGQMTIFWVYLIIESYHQSEKDKLILTSVLIASGVSIKYMPLIMLVYFLVNRQWKYIVTSILLIIGFNLLPYLFYETAYISNLYKECWVQINPFQSAFNHQLRDPATQSISSIVPFLSEFFNLNLSEKTTLIAINLLRVILLFYSVWIYHISKDKFLFFGLCLFMSSLIMPHQQHYSFFSVLVVLAYILDKLMMTKHKENPFYYGLILFVVSQVLMQLTSDLFVGKELNLQFKFLKTIGIGSLFLIASVYFFQLKKQANS